MDHETFISRHKDLRARASNDSATPEQRAKASRDLESLRQERDRQAETARRQSS
jgi:flagellin-like hook-associated protein FlgL